MEKKMKKRRRDCVTGSSNNRENRENRDQYSCCKKIRFRTPIEVSPVVVSTNNNSSNNNNNNNYSNQKRPKSSQSFDFFDGLPDDVVVSILCKLSSTARCPSDFINVLVTCKRLNGLALYPLVLSKASPKALAVRPKSWSESAHRFLKLCVDAGNIEASYTLGMIRFYCLQSRESGASLMAKAAMNSHAAALYSLAVIQFNGSGGTKTDKDLRAGVALCARAAFLGHIDALRELGHCLQDGYGVRQSVADGRRFLVQANARELAGVLSAAGLPSAAACPWMTWHPNHRHVAGAGCPLLSDFGCNVPAAEAHPASRFLVECAPMEQWIEEEEDEDEEGEGDGGG
ncbi:hypothetical protein Syun_024496 [Stephania yunnanensis]|uniref:At2g35280-like TPR domain-containing protein n=1 Tax=Stephania yunnanensis TaxID=152371 RepID=A0AAP0I4H2_9MAGN